MEKVLLLVREGSGIDALDVRQLLYLKRAIWLVVAFYDNSQRYLFCPCLCLL